MGEIKKGIRLLAREAGGKTRAKTDAMDWFETSRKGIRETAVQTTARRFRPGQVYVFRYDDPKYAEWWDRNPCVLALDPANNNDCAARNVNVGGDGSHSHSYSGTTAVNTGGAAITNAQRSGRNLPPYYALVYIIKY